MPTPPRDPDRHFWSRLNKDTESGCWEWTGCLTREGYGHVCWNRVQQGAHRLAWKLAHPKAGPLGRFDFICHKCDNKLCCRPDHLYLGTPAQNIRDAVERGQHPTCERGGGAKLTREQVRLIHDAPGKQRDIARAWGIAQSHVGRIKREEVWKEVWC